MSSSRWRAPREQGAVLVVPAWDTLADVIAENDKLVASNVLSLEGKSLTELRELARAEAEAISHRNAMQHGWPVPKLNRPLIITGHQPELYHPGVWAKNIAIAQLARKLNGSSLNLNVDSDVAKTTTLQIPSESTADHRLAVSQATPPLPYEEWQVDEASFSSVPEHFEALSANWPWKPTLSSFWKLANESKSPVLPERWLFARHQGESAKGIHNAELLMSQWCGTTFFQTLLRHFIDHASAFAQIYNEELVKYRQEHRIRSANHPVANLHDDEEMVELPFWAWPSGTTQRGRLCVRTKELVSLIAGKVHPITQHSGLSTQDLVGWKIRPKALITSMMFRLFVADLFVHGIGGAVYDELTDLIFQRYWNITLPRFAVITATQRLPWHREQVTEAVPQQLRHTLRDLVWNPDRYVHEPATTVPGKLRKRKQELVAKQVVPTALHDRHVQLQAIRNELQPYVEPQMLSNNQHLQEALKQLKQDEHHFSREHHWVLYPETLIDDLIAAFPI
jgi:hypothetical protein